MAEQRVKGTSLMLEDFELVMTNIGTRLVQATRQTRKAMIFCCLQSMRSSVSSVDARDTRQACALRTTRAVQKADLTREAQVPNRKRKGSVTGVARLDILQQTVMKTRRMQARSQQIRSW